MRVVIEGTGGVSGWPEPGCRCASCLGQVMDGSIRKQSTIVVDGVVRLGAGGGGAGDAAAGAGGAVAGDAGDQELPGGYLVRRLADARDPGRAGGWEVTTADGRRLLYPAGPGAMPQPAEGAGPYDIAFLDLLGEPAQLGLLRARGLITADTITLAAFADHRVPSEPELWRRCGFWRAQVPRDGDTVTTGRSDEKGLKDLAGTARRLDRIVLSDDPVAADATCAWLMGLVPERVQHIAEASKFLGNMSPDRIDQLAAQLFSPATPFQTVQEFEHLRAQADPRSAAPR